MFEQHYITDDKGQKISVVLPISEYNKLIEAWEEQEDIKAYDIAKSKTSQTIDAETAFDEIEKYIKQKKKS